MFKIGFRLAYQRHDPAYMAFRIAALAQELGFSTEFYPTDRKPVSVSPAWDRELVKDAKLSVNDWFKTGMTHVIYVGVVGGIEELKAAKKAGIKTFFVCLWHLLEEDDARILREFDAIIVPSRKVGNLLTDKLQLENVHHIPWDPGFPLTHDNREIDPKRLGLIWPLDGSQVVNQEPKFVSVMADLLRKVPDTWLTITYNSVLKVDALKELRKLTQVSDGRVELIRNPSWDKHALLYGYHDLTVWPTLVEGIGHVGLSSLYMGTPVIAFDYPLIGEFVRDGKSGELVPCELDTTWLGTPWVKPDYPLFSKHLQALCLDIKRLGAMREWTSVGLRERQDQFMRRWQQILGTVDDDS